MWKTVLIITVFGLQQLVESSVPKNFRESHKLSISHDELKEDLTKNKPINGNLRTFKSTPFLYFDGSVRSEGSCSFGLLLSFELL